MRNLPLFLLALLLHWSGSAQAQLRLEPYLKQDTYARIKISPDGNYYAATTPMEDRTGLVIVRRADNKVVDGVTGVKHSVIGDFWWVADDRVLIAPAERLGSRDAPYRTGQLFALGINGSHVKQLTGPQAPAGLITTINYNTQWEMTDLIDTLPDDPRHVLISVWKSGDPQITHVEKLDVYTGRRVPVITAPVRHAWFLTDAAGQVRFAQGSNDDNASKLYYRDSDAAPWRLINDWSQTRRKETPIGFSADSGTAYLQVSQPQGPDAILAWELRSNIRTQVLRDAVADPYAVILGRDGHTVLGIQTMQDGVHTQLLPGESEDLRRYRALEKGFPGLAITVTSYTRDGMALVQAWSDRLPGDTFLFNPASMRAHNIFAQKAWLDPASLPKTRDIRLQARDGLTLHGYLTLPLHAKDGVPLPLVVMPHGGPFGIFDEWGFDTDTHILAAAGYAVLRVNFRGSGNYGAAFREAGARQWGGRMQDDLTDATHWAIQQGIADASRICIYGASYGGYAALMGAAKEPDLYRCAVGYVGVYDLEDLHRTDSRSAAWMRNWANDWLGERGTLAQRSPTRLAARIQAPVLLIAGGADDIAPIKQSERMENALRTAGKPVETLYIDSEGHGFYTHPHRRALYSRLLDFLARHLGGMRASDADPPPTAP